MEDVPDDTREPETPIWTQLLEAAQDSDDPEYVAKKVAALDRIIGQVKAARADAGVHLIACLDGHRFLSTDDLRIEVKSSAPRSKWKHADLWGAISRKAHWLAQHAPIEVDRGTGERVSDLEIGVRHGIAAAKTACPSGSWTVGGIVGLGLDPDEFSERSASVDAVSVVHLTEAEPF
jgi:hypothetical protein